VSNQTVFTFLSHPVSDTGAKLKNNYISKFTWTKMEFSVHVRDLLQSGLWWCFYTSILP